MWVSGVCLRERIMRRAVFFGFIASLAVLTGCQGLGSGAPPQPTPQATINAVNHVIIMVQENRSFDSYFGHMTAFRQSANIPINSSDGKINDLSQAVGFTNKSPAVG